MAKRVVRKNYIEYAGRKFHQRADPDAYEQSLSLFEPLDPGVVLDLAAGSGLTSARLAEMGHSVTAYDVNTEQFVPSEIPIKKTDLNRPLPHEDGSIDGVMALEIIEHLESPRAFVRELGRLVRPKGIVVLSTPNIVTISSKLRFLFRSELDLFFDIDNRVNDPFCEEASGHISPILPWLLRIFLNESGFEIDRVSYTRRWGMRSKQLGRAMLLRAIRK